MKIIDPGGNGEPVTAVWVYLVQHGKQDEAVAGFKTGDSWMPMVASSNEGLRALGSVAQVIATQSGKPLTLVRFDHRTDVGTVRP